jgi:hypothetical protein
MKNGTPEGEKSLAACCTCGFFALDAAKISDYRAARTFGPNAVCIDPNPACDTIVVIADLK